MSAPYCEWIPHEDDDRTIDQLRAAVGAEPGNPYLAERLAALTNNELLWASTKEANQLLDEIRSIQRRFPVDEYIASSLAMAITNCAADASTEEQFVCNELLLSELNSLVDSIQWNEHDPQGYALTILGSQYLGLLGRREYQRAEDQMDAITIAALDGSHDARLSWLIALRHGFWVLRDHGDFDRIESQLAVVRAFRRDYPGDDYEAPHALLAMLLGTFEVAERTGKFTLADERFDEACALGPDARDDYGHVERIYALLVAGEFGCTARAVSQAVQLDASWLDYGLRTRIGPPSFRAN